MQSYNQYGIQSMKRKFTFTQLSLAILTFVLLSACGTVKVASSGKGPAHNDDAYFSTSDLEKNPNFNQLDPAYVEERRSEGLNARRVGTSYGQSYADRLNNFGNRRVQTAAAVMAPMPMVNPFFRPAMPMWAMGFNSPYMSNMWNPYVMNPYCMYNPYYPMSAMNAWNNPYYNPYWMNNSSWVYFGYTPGYGWYNPWNDPFFFQNNNFFSAWNAPRTSVWNNNSNTGNNNAGPRRRNGNSSIVNPNATGGRSNSGSNNSGWSFGNGGNTSSGSSTVERPTQSTNRTHGSSNTNGVQRRR